MADLDDDYLEVLVINFVDGSVVTLPYSVPARPRELLAPCGARVSSESGDTGDELAAQFHGHALEFLDRRRLDEEPIVCHDA